jgi:hypothetical protein
VPWLGLKRLSGTGSANAVATNGCHATQTPSLSNAPNVRARTGTSPDRGSEPRPRRPRLDSGGGLARMNKKPRTAQAMYIVCPTIGFTGGLAGSSQPGPVLQDEQPLTILRSLIYIAHSSYPSLKKFGGRSGIRTRNLSRFRNGYSHPMSRPGPNRGRFGLVN